jgi:hypothetical protein
MPLKVDCLRIEESEVEKKKDEEGELKEEKEKRSMKF